MSQQVFSNSKYKPINLVGHVGGTSGATNSAANHTVVFVEYRDTNGIWHLLKSYTPIEEIININSENLVSDSEEFCISNTIYCYEPVNSFFKDPFREFFNRGFPKDLSDCLKEILDLEKENVDNINKEANTNDESVKFNHDNRSFKSWCYLSELKASSEESYNKAMRYYLREKTNSTLNKIYSKLDDIYDKLFNVTREDDFLKDCEEAYPDELYDLIEVKEFCFFIESLVKFITKGKILNEDIRLVYYNVL